MQTLTLLETTETPRPAFLRAGIGSILVHVVLLVVLTWVARLPAIPVETRLKVVDLRKSMPLVAPPRELTQKDPNRAKVSKQLDLESLTAPPQTQAQARQMKKFGGVPAPQAPTPAPPTPAVPEPPKMERPATLPALGLTPTLAPPVAPPPQIQAEEKPKLAFETPGTPSGSIKGNARIPAPPGSLNDVIRTMPRSGGGTVVGDAGDDISSISQLPGAKPAPGRNGSSLEMLSDPQGVDFKPYLIRVLAAVRRNWFAVMPESARMGRPGRTVIQFIVARDGKVPKLVIATGSGAEALDRAAVAGISASNPFPPLPPEFRGDQVRLQLVFSYNMPK